MGSRSGGQRTKGRFGEEERAEFEARERERVCHGGTYGVGEKICAGLFRASGSAAEEVDLERQRLEAHEGRRRYVSKEQATVNRLYSTRRSQFLVSVEVLLLWFTLTSVTGKSNKLSQPCFCAHSKFKMFRVSRALSYCTAYSLISTMCFMLKVSALSQSNECSVL